MEGEMHSDAEFLSEICDSTPRVRDRISRREIVVNAKTISGWTGLSAQTVSDYRTGRYNIPVSFWRSVLDHWFYTPIVSLLVPDTVNFSIFDELSPRPVEGAEFFRAALEETAAYYEKQRQIADLLADGRIDEIDEAAVREYCNAYIKSVSLGHRLHVAILQRFERTATGSTA